MNIIIDHFVLVDQIHILELHPLKLYFYFTDFSSDIVVPKYGLYSFIKVFVVYKNWVAKIAASTL